MKSWGRWARWTWVALLAASPAAAQSNLVVNGGFEQPAIGFGSFSIFGSIPGWTTTVGGGIAGFARAGVDARQRGRDRAGSEGTAKALGLAIPHSVLVRADDVIR